MQEVAMTFNIIIYLNASVIRQDDEQPVHEAIVSRTPHDAKECESVSMV
jgi:hypothetical protein